MHDRHPVVCAVQLWSSLQKTHQQEVISKNTFTLALCEVCANNKQIDEDRRA